MDENEPAQKGSPLNPNTSSCIGYSETKTKPIVEVKPNPENGDF